MSSWVTLACDRVPGMDDEPRGQRGTASQGDAPRKAPAAKPPMPVLPEIGQGVPLVGEEGTDAHGYPRQRPDSTVLLAMLLQERYAELDEAIGSFEAKFENDFHYEAWPRQALESFAVPSETLRPKLDAWIEASPESFAARAARGLWLDAMAWRVRGGGFVSETLDVQLRGMEQLHLDARKDLAAAMVLRPKAVVPHQWAMSIARSHDDEAELEREYAAALDKCPKCFDVRRTYVLAQGWRWGGSQEAMTTAATTAPVGANAKLEALQGIPAYDRCRDLFGKKKYDAALAECARAETAGADPIFTCLRARILYVQDRHLESLRAAEEGLRQDPQEYDCLRVRMWSRQKLSDLTLAGEDLLTLRRLDPWNEELYAATDWMTKRLAYQAQQSEAAGRAEAAARDRALADAIVPGSGKRRFEAGPPEETIVEHKRQVQASPDDFEP